MRAENESFAWVFTTNFRPQSTCKKLRAAYAFVIFAALDISAIFLTLAFAGWDVYMCHFSHASDA
jgi:hypothetical protein